MGLYAIDCPSCKKPHMWFSGSMDQRCAECKKPREWWLPSSYQEDSEDSRKECPELKHIKVIEKSAYDFLAKQVAELQTQILTEKAEVSRLLALNKRRTK